MPKFVTPGPIEVLIERFVGEVRLVAEERSETVVEVLPSGGAEEAEAPGAEAVEVQQSGDRLVVRGPRQPRWIRHPRTFDVVITLPSGSSLDAQLDLGSVTCRGQLAACRVRSPLGRLNVERTAALFVRLSMGDLSADLVEGDADLATAGEIRVGRVAGSATVKNSNGGTWIGEVAGDLLVRSSNGDIRVDRAGSSVVAKSANGSVRVGEVARGAAVLETSVGEVAVGIRPGSAAWLDVGTSFGTVHNRLEAASGPEGSDSTVEVTARTRHGDVVIERAPS